MTDWTSEAQHRWNHIPADQQETLLAQVWCPHCSEIHAIILDGGTMVAKDLVLTGRCTECGQRTARLLEYEPPIADDAPFQPGESVIWLKRLPGGPYVIPLTATVLAVTPKRIKIRADDDGTSVVRFVPPANLQRRTVPD